MNENVIGGKFSLDISDLTKSLNKANRLINISNSEFKAATAGINNWADTTDGLNKKIKNLNEVIKLQEGRVSDLKIRWEEIKEAKKENTVEGLTLQRRINEETAALNKNKAELVKYENALNDTARQVKELEGQLSILNNEYAEVVKQQGKNSDSAKTLKSQIDILTSEHQELASQLEEEASANKKLNDSNKELDGGFTILKGTIANLVAEGFKKLISVTIESAKEIANAGIKFESAFTGVKKTVDASEQELAILKKGIIDLSKEMPASATEIAAVAEAAGQLGIDTDKILGFTKVMVDLGESTNLSATEAATSLAKFANITSMSADDYDKLGSVIVSLGNNMATTEADIVSMATRLASTGELTGLSEAQIMALAASMSSVGIEAEAGGTAMSKLLKEIQVSVETGSKDLDGFAKVAGMTSSDFKKAFEKDAVSALSSFIGGLNDTERNGKSAIQILEDMGLTEVRLSNTVLSLANASGVMNEAIDIANTGWEENNALTKEAEQRYKTTESKISMMKNEMTALGIAIFEKFKKPFLDALSSVSKMFKDLGKQLQSKEMSKSIDTIATALGKFIKNIVAFVAKTLPKFLKGLSDLIKNWDKLKPIIISVTAAIIAYKIATVDLEKGSKLLIVANKLLSGTFTALKNPIGAATTATKAFNTTLKANAIGLVISAVVGLIAALGSLIKKYDEQQTSAMNNSFFDNQGVSIDLLTEKIKKNTETYGILNDRINEFGGTLEANRTSIDNASGDLDYYMLRMQTTGTVTEEEAGQIKTAFETIKDNIKSNLETSSQLIVTLLQNKVHDATNAAGLDFDTLSLKIMDFNGLLGGQLDNIEKQMQPFLDKMANGEALNDEEKSTFLKLRNQMIALDSKVSETQTKWNDTLANMDKIDFGEDTEAAKTAISNLNTYASELLTELNEGRTNALNEVDTGIKQVNSLFEQGVLTPEAKEEWLKVWEQVRENINTGYAEQEEGIKTQLTEAGQKIQSSLDESLEELAANTAPTFWQAVKGSFVNVVDINDGVDQVVRKKIQKEIGDPIQEELNNLANTVGVDSFETITKNVIPDDADYFHVKESFSELSKYGMEGAAQGIKDNEKLPEAAFGDFTTNFIQYTKSQKGFDINSPSKKMIPIGKYVMQGFEKGILNQEASVKYNVVSAMKRIVNAARKELDINSPSGVFETIGKFLMQGLEVGIDKESTNVVKKVKEVSSTLSNSMKNQLVTASSSLNATANLGINSNNGGLVNGITKNVVGGKSIVVNQTINSPKALSRSEIYRQTKNIATSIAQGG